MINEPMRNEPTKFPRLKRSPRSADWLLYAYEDERIYRDYKPTLNHFIALKCCRHNRQNHKGRRPRLHPHKELKTP